MSQELKYSIGIDEAGRGPLAGPVAVGLVLAPINFDWERLPGVTDSKKLSEKKREEIYTAAKKLEKIGLLCSVVVLGSAKQIDRQGIVVVIRGCIEKGLERLSTRSGLELGTNSVKDLVLTRKEVLVKLDGGLRAPAEWVHQETIIKGDAKEKVIGLASIMAKVTRDRYMRRVAERSAYSAYDFATHKGYGTKAHRVLITEYGLSPEHRTTFCKNIKCVV